MLKTLLICEKAKVAPASADIQHRQRLVNYMQLKDKALHARTLIHAMLYDIIQDSCKNADRIRYPLGIEACPFV